MASFCIGLLWQCDVCIAWLILRAHASAYFGTDLAPILIQMRCSSATGASIHVTIAHICAVPSSTWRTRSLARASHIWRRNDTGLKVKVWPNRIRINLRCSFCTALLETVSGKLSTISTPSWEKLGEEKIKKANKVHWIVVNPNEAWEREMSNIDIYLPILRTDLTFNQSMRGYKWWTDILFTWSVEWASIDL